MPRLQSDTFLFILLLKVIHEQDTVSKFTAHIRFFFGLVSVQSIYQLKSPNGQKYTHSLFHKKFKLSRKKIVPNTKRFISLRHAGVHTGSVHRVPVQPIVHSHLDKIYM